MLAAAIEQEVASYVADGSGLLDEVGRRLVVRNGFLPERDIMTGIGKVPVKQPRVRDKRPPELSERCPPSCYKRGRLRCPSTLRRVGLSSTEYPPNHLQTEHAPPPSPPPDLMPRTRTRRRRAVQKPASVRVRIKPVEHYRCDPLHLSRSPCSNTGRASATQPFRVQQSTTAIAGKRDKVDAFFVIVDSPLNHRSVALLQFLPVMGIVD
jgi:hypothetical protein